MTTRYIFISLLVIFVSGCSYISPETTSTPVPPTSSLPRLPSLTASPSPPSTEDTTPTVLIQPSPALSTQVSASVTVEQSMLSAEVASAPSLPDIQDYNWKLVIDGLQKPVGLVNAGDGSMRIFVVEQEGRIRIVNDGELSTEPFLDIIGSVGSMGSEQGLLGLAFHPRFAETGNFYVNYTDLNGNTIIARFSVSNDNPNRADPNSEKRLLVISQPYGNHNGGAVVFGPDGFLYLGLGDGGSANDPHGNGQSTNTFLGKILRVDIDEGENYAIPQDNPFVNGGGLPEIWAIGLRNPWRFAFDRLTWDLYIGDVGQNAWEEIDFSQYGHPPGANFGWNFREGTHTFESTPPGDLTLIDPIVEYDHSQGCSVTGGVVYRGTNLPAWQGVYVYGDYCSGKVWGLVRTLDSNWQEALLFETGANISTFGEDEAGEMYLVDHNGGIYRLSD